MHKVGISLCGGYLPIYRIDRKLIADNWGRSCLGGERAVANNDEDAITMAVEAARNCLCGVNKDEVDGLFFATTSAPYQEKMNSAMIATAADLKRDIVTADFAHSLRTGTGALKAALDSVKAGSTRSVLVTSADCRLGYPRSDQEQNFGDGAAAVLVSDQNIIATFEGDYSICNEMHDVWRNPEDTYVRTWEGRFILGEGYTNHMVEVIQGILKKYQLAPKDISTAVLPASDLKTHKGLVRKLGLDPETQVQDPLLSSVGFCGAAQPLLMLVAALEDARPGDLLLLANYADGADALLFKVTENCASAGCRRKLRELLDHNIMLTSYARFLSYKGLIEAMPGEPFRLFPSATVTWRERNSIIRAHGSRCQQCGATAFPVQRICFQCHSKDQFVEVPLADREGEVFTFTLDNLAGRSDDPVIVQTIAQLEDNARFYGMMTDCVPSEVKLGMPVKLTFRRIYDGMGIHNYFWKLRPVIKESVSNG
ncbi:MAG: hydroxymethylglutaryl-CoA synthase family protein [Desulfomonile tiedjei]|nr:hydroxymethylglutaryl-CoA synthase family protein [Desulfomonile tiedjei]